MSMIEIENKLKRNAETVNAALEKYLDLHDNDFNVLYDSMRYSTLSAGKRIRAFLTLEFFEMFANINGVPGGHALQVILPVACAIEMIHTYSLIHDDLPCMDDDDLRRGLPSNHKKFDEATALLAGDALLTYAFNIIADAKFLPDDKKVRIISEISNAAGHAGMIGGQATDILYENKKINIINLIKIYTLKAGCLITAAARTGCIAGGAGEQEIDTAMNYAKNIGIAFQVIDDILDGNGIVNGILDVTAAYEYAEKLTDEAIFNLEELKKINKNADTKNLELLAKYLLERKI